MWHRDESRPTPYAGVTFRSALEARAAEQLDILGVAWEYELAATHPDSGAPIDWYLPDFTITKADPDLDLPTWLEVKPDKLLWAVRDHLGCPERFEGTHVAEINARELCDAQLTEIWKPKRLAEVSGHTVLVAYQLNATRSLSILMFPDRIELSRSHPATNRKGVLARREREEEQRRWREEYDRAQAEREEQDQLRQQQIIDYARTHGKPARFNGWCQICRSNEVAQALIVYQASDQRWVAVCRSHLNEAPAPRGRP